MSVIGVTNRKLCIDFYNQIEKIAKSKLDYLIIREKDLSDEELLNLVLKIKEKLKNTKIKIIVNTPNIKIAEKANIDGIQLSFNDFIDISNKLHIKETSNLEYMSNKYKIFRMVGVSIHSYEEGIKANELGADYVIYGHVFKTDCKKGVTPRGTNEIEILSKKISIPILGIGGIDENNYKEVLESGAKGICIMSSLMKSENPEGLIELFYN